MTLFFPAFMHFSRTSQSIGNMTCLTCENVNNTYNWAEVLSNGKYLVQDVRGSGTPKTFLKRINKNLTETNSKLYYMIV